MSLKLEMNITLFLIAVAIVGIAVVGPVALTTPAFAPSLLTSAPPTPASGPITGSPVSTGVFLSS